MTELNPYLHFEGKCREAMTFYKSCFGGKLDFMTYGDAPTGSCPDGAKDQIMHARLEISKTLVIMSSDCPPGNYELKPGNNIQLSVTCESNSEADKLYASLGAKGHQIMPLQDMFWGARFGMLTDQFGIIWMISGPSAKK